MWKRPLFGLIWSMVIALTGVSPALADAKDFAFDSFTANYYLSRDSHRISHLHVVLFPHDEIPARMD